MFYFSDKAPKFSSPLLQEMFNNKLRPGSRSGSDGEGSPPEQRSPGATSPAKEEPQVKNLTDFENL